MGGGGGWRRKKFGFYSFRRYTVFHREVNSFRTMWSQIFPYFLQIRCGDGSLRNRGCIAFPMHSFRMTRGRCTDPAPHSCQCRCWKLSIPSKSSNSLAALRSGWSNGRIWNRNIWCACIKRGSIWSSSQNPPENATAYAATKTAFELLHFLVENTCNDRNAASVSTGFLPKDLVIEIRSSNGQNNYCLQFDGNGAAYRDPSRAPICWQNWVAVIPLGYVGFWMHVAFGTSAIGLDTLNGRSWLNARLTYVWSRAAKCRSRRCDITVGTR